MLCLQCFSPINHHNSASCVSESFYVLTPAHPIVIRVFTLKCFSFSSSVEAVFFQLPIGPIPVGELWHWVMIMKGQEKIALVDRTFPLCQRSYCILSDYVCIVLPTIIS